jgi:hypothetical protein
MTEDFNNWSKDEFLGFVLIDASFADKLIQEAEKAIITHILPIDRFYQLLEFYRFNDQEVNRSIILNLKNKFYITNDDNYELRDKIKSIFLSDGQYSWMERDLEKSFDKLFE